MKPILVIGCGNPLRSDDGVGRHAARQIAATVSPSDVTVLVRHQLTPDLAEPVYKARLVIFIDASCEDPPGKIRSRRIVPANGECRETLQSDSRESENRKILVK
jgi:hydrogenase maturation protease